MANHGLQALKTLLLLMPVFMCQVVLNSSKIEGPVKNDQLTVMISITSGPHHSHMRSIVRNTWLLPCIASTVCNYRFYVDAMAANLTEALKAEQQTHDDLVFRGPWCSLMDQHPAYINYGNNVVGTENVVGGFRDYPRRALYKIDWKVCFLQWATQNRAMAAYHAFVEDDSFLCTAHLLHLTTLLKNLDSAEKHKPFRTGYDMYDGFDDSSTFMSREVAEAFANYYPSKDFDCAHMLNISNVVKRQWLSWGNSWMHEKCGWRLLLQDTLNISINEPSVSKLMLHCEMPPAAAKTNLTATSPSTNDSLPFPCPQAGLVFHHPHAAEALLKEQKVEHLCEYALFIDKIKDPMHIRKLYHTANASSFHDFTPVFIADGMKGWHAMIKKINSKEEQCRRDGRSLPCLEWRRQRRLQSDSTHRTHSPRISASNSHDQSTDPGPSFYFK